MSDVVGKFVKYLEAHVGDRYNQNNRYGDGVYDCSSLIYRAYESAGVKLVHRTNGSRVDTSTYEVYAKDFNLIYPGDYSSIGKKFAPKDITNKLQAGDIIFYNTFKSERSNKITHVSGVCNSQSIIHARNTQKGVRKDPITYGNTSICAVIRYKDADTGNSNSNSSSASGSANDKTELDYLKKLKNLVSKPIQIQDIEIKDNKSKDHIVKLYINHKDKLYEPAVLDGMTLDLERAGAPGKLCFDIYYDKVVQIQEGDEVRLEVDDAKVFYGFIFVLKPDFKGNTLSITAYDQLRYLKNKQTYQYKNKTASQLIKMIAKDFQLQCGDIADTKFVIKSKIEDEKTLFDIIQNALDDTLLNKMDMYILYDNFGKITLKHMKDMKVNLLIDPTTTQDIDYQSSIDGETYNKIKLTYKHTDKDDKTGNETEQRDVYIAQSTKSINQWGLLQYNETIDDPKIGKLKADALLEYYNTKTRNLTIRDAFGDTRVRAGSSLPVMLDLGDIKVDTYMMVEKVKHTFENREHSMDLTLRGGVFIV